MNDLPGNVAALEQLHERLATLPHPAAMLEEIFANAPAGLQIYAASGHCVLVNPRHSEMFGGVPPPDYNVFEDTVLIERGVADLVRRAFAGERIVIPPIWYDIRDLQNIEVDSGGRRFAVGAELVPLRAAGKGEVSHVLFVFHDVTDLHQAREAAERAAEQARQARVVAEAAAAQAAFLAEAGRALSSSLDHEVTLIRLARLATPALADFCIVDLLADDGTVRRVAASHADPSGQPVLDELCRRYPPHAGSPQPAMRVIRSGEAELLAEVDPEVVAQHTLDREHYELMLRLGVRSHLAVPLVFGQRILGAISMGYVGARRYQRNDIPLVEALASRAAVAIENARLYQDAERARAEAESASRAKDGFLAMLGHELRNPLSPIVTALQLMRMRDDTATRREQEIIQRQVSHLVRLVDDLLDVSRITRGHIELKTESVAVSDVLMKAVEMASLLMEQRGHRLHLDIEAGLHWVVDPVRLAQVVANLLINAARYTDMRGDIWLQSQRVGEARVRIGVRDNGMGIPADVLPRLFEPFYQGRRGVDRAEGGLGIGLTLVKSLVTMHGGTVEAHSAGMGRGSEFVIHLPLRASRMPGSSTHPREPDDAMPAGFNRRVLIVDDNVDGAETLGRLLRSCGHEVQVFHDPVSALQALQAFTPEIALLDIGLPVIDGYELAKRIREALAGKACRLIAVTGYGQDADKARSHEAGFELHLVKPLDPSKVASLMA